MIKAHSCCFYPLVSRGATFKYAACFYARLADLRGIHPLISQWRTFVGAAALGGLLVGSWVWVWVESSSEEKASARISEVLESSAQALDRIRRLEAELTQERSRADRLVRELALLEEEKAKESGAGLGLDSSNSGESATATDAEPLAGSTDPWFDQRRLVELGLPLSEVDRIKEAWEAYVMRKLEIQNERSRKGQRTPEIDRWNFMNEASLRQELGDDAYDAMRFASGERNRVFFTELLENSPGTEAGLMPEDELISYAEKRVFTPSELKVLTTQGERDEWVEVEVMRRGELRRFFIPRGPIGALLDFRLTPPLRAN